MENPTAAEMPEVDRLRWQIASLRAEQEVTQGQRNAAMNIIAKREAALKVMGDAVEKLTAQIGDLQKKVAEYANNTEQKE